MCCGQNEPGELRMTMATASVWMEAATSILQDRFIAALLHSERLCWQIPAATTCLLQNIIPPAPCNGRKAPAEPPMTRPSASAWMPAAVHTLPATLQALL